MSGFFVSRPLAFLIYLISVQFQKEFIEVGKNPCAIFAPDDYLQAKFFRLMPEVVFVYLGLVIFKISKHTIKHFLSFMI